MPYEIRQARALPRRLAAVTAMATLPEMPRVIPRKLGEVWQFIGDHSLTSACHNVVVYLNSSNVAGNETLFDMLCGVEVHEELPPSDSIKPIDTSAGRVAVATHWAPYDQLPDVHAAVRLWVSDHSLKLSGPSWEVYGDWSEDPANLRTDVYYLLAE